jgi:tetratricopeptide (TPR) repeat protein
MSARLKFCAAMLLAALSAAAPGAGGDAAALESMDRLERTPAADPAAIADVDVLALDEPARRFVEQSVRGIREPYAKVRALRRAVFDGHGLAFVMNDALTLTAQEAFDQAGGNCLALANFFVAAARHLGIDADYQEVHRQAPGRPAAPNVVVQHVNVSGELTWLRRPARYVLDYLAVPEEDFGHSRVISDRRALAHYYNNLGMERLGRRDLESALQYLKKAVRADGATDFVWSNLGVVYARRGDREAAAFAYRRALALNGELVSARRNLALLLGDGEKPSAAGSGGY